MRVTRCDRESPPRRITIPQQDRFWRSQFWSSDSLSGAMGDTHSRISPDGPVFGNRFERRAWSQLYDLLWGLWWRVSSCRSVVVAKRKSKTASLLSKYFRKTDDCYGDLLLGREQTPPQRWPSTATRVLPLLFPSKNNNKVLVLQKAVTSLKWHEHFTGSCNNANDYWYLNWLEWHNIPRLVPRTASFFGIFSASDEWYWYEVVESAPTLRHWVPRV